MKNQDNFFKQNFKAQNIFAHQTFDIFVLVDSNTLVLEFKEEYIRLETLFELENFLGWLSEHIEVSCLLITSKQEILTKGLNFAELKYLGEKKYLFYCQKVHQIIKGLFSLPQLLIFDFKQGSSPLGMELSLAADLRIIHSTGEISFNGLHTGMANACGGNGLLKNIITPSMARKWQLFEKSVSSCHLLKEGFVHESYDDNSRYSILEGYLKTIKEKSPFTRMQAKAAAKLFDMDQLEEALQEDLRFALEVYKMSDWQSYLETKDKKKPSFIELREVKEDYLKEENRS